MQQRIQIFGTLAESGDTTFSLIVRSAGGDPVVVIPPGRVPRTAPLAPGKPAIDVSFCLATGAYPVDASLGSKFATAVPFSTSPGTSWDIDLR